MKKIVVFYKSFQKYGGQEKFVYNFAHHFAAKGYDVEIYSYRIKDNPVSDKIRLKKVFVPPFLPVSLKTLLFSIFSYFMAKRLKKKNSDICIFGFGKTFYQDIYRSGGGVHKYYFRRATLKYKTATGRFFYRLKKYLSAGHWVNIFIEELTFKSRHLKKIIAPSEFVKKQIMEEFKCDGSRIVVIRNGVDLKRFKMPQDRGEFKKRFGLSDDFVFCFVSSNHRLKGLQYLLPAVAELKKIKKFKLLIAGSGGDRFFKAMVKKLNLGDVVVWLGKQDRIENVYMASDALVYPTLFDVSSNVVLEAMACGVVPISSVYNGTSELIEEGANGFLIGDPTDPEQIRGKMLRVLDSDIKKLSFNAYNTVSKYASDEIFDRIEKLLRDTC